MSGEKNYAGAGKGCEPDLQDCCKLNTLPRATGASKQTCSIYHCIYEPYENVSKLYTQPTLQEVLLECSGSSSMQWLCGCNNRRLHLQGHHSPAEQGIKNQSTLLSDVVFQPLAPDSANSHCLSELKELLHRSSANPHVLLHHLLILQESPYPSLFRTLLLQVTLSKPFIASLPVCIFKQRRNPQIFG